MLMALRQVMQYNGEDKPARSTVAVIDGNMDFHKTDGYIQFMRITMDEAVKFHRLHGREWEGYLDMIYGMAERLQDKCVRFDDATETFREYCERISHAMDDGSVPSLDRIGICTAKDSGMLPFVQVHLDKGNRLGFYYDEDDYEKDGDIGKLIMDEAMDQLSRLKFAKTSRQYDISQYLTASGYHEHVHDALNVLMELAVYAVNCSSARDREAYGFDIQEVQNRLGYARIIMERTKMVI